MKKIKHLEFILKGEFKTKRVWMNGKKLIPSKSQKVNNHSPDGFNWGYFGSGPSQLALSILLEIFDIDHATNSYRQFTYLVLGHLPKTDFHIKVEMTDGELKTTHIS